MDCVSYHRNYIKVEKKEILSIQGLKFSLKIINREENTYSSF